MIVPASMTEATSSQRWVGKGPASDAMEELGLDLEVSTCLHVPRLGADIE